MKFKIQIVIVAVLIISDITAQELSFEDYNPKSTLVVPGKHIE